MLNETNLHKYQWRGHDHIINTTHCGLFLDMGLGKTVTTLTAINTLIYGDLSVDKVLVIAPKRVAENVWHREIQNWTHLKDLTISRVIGTPKQRENALKKKADIYILGRDNVTWLTAKYGGASVPFDMLVIDESSSFKNAKSKRFKALRKLHFDRVVLLTGTPAPNTMIDLWSQIYLLDRGERLGEFITHFRDRFFKAAASQGHVVYKYQAKKNAEKHIHKLIGDICISMKAKDYLDLPKRIDRTVPIVFGKKLQKQYDDFAKEQIMEIMAAQEDDGIVGEITAANAAALSNKLLQFANGAVYDADRNVHEIHDLKLQELEQIVENANGQPVLVAYAFQHDQNRILKRLEKYGAVKMKTEEHVTAWNKGEIPVMIMHPASGGHGLNLQAGGNIIVWFGQNWSLELYQQLNARLHRQGQTKPVIIHHLVAEKTIDQKVVAALERKGDMQDSLMAATKATIKQYQK